MAQRWLVWLGALALGLGALFVAGWAVEQGLVGPQVRVLGAALLGFALLGLGERARRGQAAAGNDLVAPALAAGGLCALYGAALAAHLAYGLVEPGVAFLLLALASGLGAALGLRFGPLVGLLGSIGACVTPAFVQTQAPADWPLFLYLGCRGRARGTGAALGPGGGRLGGVGRGGGVGGRVAGRGGARQAAGRLPGGTGAAPAGVGARRDRGAVPAPPDRASPGRGLAWAFRLTAVAAVLLLQPVLSSSGFAVAPLLALAALALAAVTAAWLLDRERWLAALATVGGCSRGGVASRPGGGDGTAASRDPAPARARGRPLAAALALTGALAFVLGLAGAWRGRQPGYWAGLSAAGPLAAWPPPTGGSVSSRSARASRRWRWSWPACCCSPPSGRPGGRSSWRRSALTRSG